MKCPKCGCEQVESTQCQACGVYFKKYWQMQKRIVYGEPVNDEKEEPAGKRGVIVGAIAVCVVIAYAVFSGEDEPSRKTAVDTSAAIEVAKTGTAPPTPDPVKMDVEGDASPIEHARNATVLIRTNMGGGSGFFISAKCDIITNRHVIKADENVLNAATNELDEAETELNAYKEQIDTARTTFFKKCSDCGKDAYEREIGQYEKRIEEIEKVVAEQRSKIFNIQWDTDVAITLADGAEHVAYMRLMSPG